MWAFAVYVLGGLLGVIVFAKAARSEGYTLSGDTLTLAAIAFFLWPLILPQMVFLFFENRKDERNRMRLRGRV